MALSQPDDVVEREWSSTDVVRPAALCAPTAIVGGIRASLISSEVALRYPAGESKAVLMTRTLVDIDDELLARAQEILGAGTKKDTVNGALKEVIAVAARRAFLDAGRKGAFTELADKEVRDGLWRR
jgi:Arc/MetJ family transcription regulator